MIETKVTQAIPVNPGNGGPLKYYSSRVQLGSWSIRALEHSTFVPGGHGGGFVRKVIKHINTCKNIFKSIKTLNLSIFANIVQELVADGELLWHHRANQFDGA